MKNVRVEDISKKIAECCIDINSSLSDDMIKCLKKAEQIEKSENGRNILDLIEKNIKLAKKNHRPICQDTGMDVVFVKYGQDVHIEGGSLEDAINEGIRAGYCNGYLRKSVVSDPIIRQNSNDNTPAVIHYQIVPGNQLEITIMPKGFGSENTSALKMLKPSDGIEGVFDFVYETIEKGAPNACAPIIVGVGIGGTFEKAAVLAKKALTIPVGTHNSKSHLAKLEKDLYIKANNSGIGPMGMGGINTVLGVNILDYPTHIAGLPVAVNICCYVNRHGKVVF